MAGSPGEAGFAPAGALACCELCPRRCRANRAAGERGFCGAGVRARVFRYGPHHGEEPPISGSRGSGTVFFSHCTLRCLYCQNYPWSQEARGEEYDTPRLAAALGRLRAAGCHNWNLVSPTPWLPAISGAIEAAQRDGPRLPVVYNTSGFERVEVLRALRGTVDIYLTDLRYARADTAAEGSGHAGYVDVARAAFREMWRQAGPLRMDGEGVAAAGTVCRLLVLPGRAGEAVDNLEWLAAETDGQVAVSVMSQYVPAYRAPRTPTWDRPVTREEYAAVCEATERLGFSEGWIQEFGGGAPAGLVGFEMREGGDEAGASAAPSGRDR